MPCAASPVRRLSCSSRSPASIHPAHCQPAVRSSARMAAFFASLVAAARASLVSAATRASASTDPISAQPRRGAACSIVVSSRAQPSRGVHRAPRPITSPRSRARRRRRCRGWARVGQARHARPRTRTRERAARRLRQARSRTALRNAGFRILRRRSSRAAHRDRRHPRVAPVEDRRDVYRPRRAGPGAPAADVRAHR